MIVIKLRNKKKISRKKSACEQQHKNAWINNKNANKMNAKQKLKAVPTVTYQQKKKNHTQRLNKLRRPKKQIKTIIKKYLWEKAN